MLSIHQLFSKYRLFHLWSLINIQTYYCAFLAFPGHDYRVTLRNCVEFFVGFLDENNACTVQCFDILCLLYFEEQSRAKVARPIVNTMKWAVVTVVVYQWSVQSYRTCTFINCGQLFFILVSFHIYVIIYVLHNVRNSVVTYIWWCYEVHLKE
jgi:hypothetical protein